VIPLGLEPKTLPLKSGMLYQLIHQTSTKKPPYQTEASARFL